MVKEDFTFVVLFLYEKNVFGYRAQLGRGCDDMGHKDDALMDSADMVREQNGREKDACGNKWAAREICVCAHLTQTR